MLSSWLLSPAKHLSTSIEPVVTELADVSKYSRRVPEVVIEPAEILSKAPKNLYQIKKSIIYIVRWIIKNKEAALTGSLLFVMY